MTQGQLDQEVINQTGIKQVVPVCVCVCVSACVCVCAPACAHMYLQ
jgi:hypothetical protein